MKRIFLFVLSSLLITIIFSLTLPTVESRVFSGGCGTPIIDGVINPTEWENADSEPWTSVSASGTLYIMNDDLNLYIAVIINGDDDFGSDDGFRIYFDNDNGGETSLEDGDDYIAISGASTFADAFYSTFYGSIVADDSPAIGGTNDGQAAGSRQGSSNHFEASHPLDSGDAGHDFSLSAGQIVGFILNPKIDNTYESILWGLLSNPSTWLHDYGVAECETDQTDHPVGGVFYSTDKMGLLSPWIVTICFIGCIAVISFVAKSRRA